MIGEKVALFYGGGQIPSANYVLGKTSEELLKRGLEVYGIHQSFMGLADPNCYEEFTLLKARDIQEQIGTYLSTCRNVNPADDKWFDYIIFTLQDRDIRTLIIAGGDGSSKAGSKLAERAKKEGYEIQIVFIPCTIDGINGSDTIGIDSAIAESVKQSILIIANAFATWNPNFLGPRIAIIETNGRNLNHLGAGTVKKIIDIGTIGSYNVQDIDLMFIPAGYDWSYNELMEHIVSSRKETAIIISEGAKPIEPYWNATTGSGVGEKLTNLIKTSGKRDVNFHRVGYLSQTNDQISVFERTKIDAWVKFAVQAMFKTDETMAVIKTTGFETVSLHDFAQGTQSEEPIPLSKEEFRILRPYLV